MAHYWPPKDPDELLDFENDWTKRLAGDTITLSTFTVVTGDCTVDTSENNDPITKVWLAGGTLGETCTILNRIETGGGRIHDWTMSLKIKAK